MTEAWRDVQGYENIYQVSSSGKVKRLSYETKNPGPRANGSVLKFKEHFVK